MMKKQKLLTVISAILLASLPLQVVAEVNPLFNPSVLIEDKVFSDTQTFGGPQGIQQFLESKKSILANTNPDFLVKLKEPSFKDLKILLEDPQPALGRLRTAAELIWDASRQSGLNPQVILVTLQKEQGLITNHQNDSPEVLQKALDRAMGFDCPDSTGCGNLFPGFYFQLFGNVDTTNNRYLGATKSLMKSFNTAGGRGPAAGGRAAKVGEVITLSNTTGGPNNAPESQTVLLSNNATAALYRFTPHVFNGNYNFWKYFNEWFKYPNGTLLKLADSTTTYIIQNGSRQMVPPFVATARGLDFSKTITVSPNELEGYPVGTVLGPLDDTVVQVPGEAQKYVFIKSVKHPASDFVITQRKLHTSQVLPITPAESQLFTNGDMLTPSDGTVLRGQTSHAVYLVEGGKLKLFSAFTFQQRKVAKAVQLVPETEVASYPKQGFVAPVDGTLVKSSNSQSVYAMGNGTRHPLTAELFNNRKLSFKNVVVLAADEVESFPLDGFAQPSDRTYFKAGDTGQLYIYKEGAKHSISSFVAKQRGITPDFTFGKAEVNSWTEGIAVPPRDGTVVKGDKDATVFLVAKGQLQPLTFEAFTRRKLTAKKITVLPQAEVDSYAKGEVLTK